MRDPRAAEEGGHPPRPSVGSCRRSIITDVEMMAASSCGAPLASGADDHL